MVLLANISLQTLLNSSHGQVYCPKRWSAKFNVQVNIPPKMGPGWRGTVQVLSTVPTVDWVFLGSCKSKKGHDLSSLYMQTVC